LSGFSVFAQKQKVVAEEDGKCIEGKWELAFEDNFDSSALNLDTWYHKPLK